MNDRVVYACSVQFISSGNRATRQIQSYRCITSINFSQLRSCGFTRQGLRQWVFVQSQKHYGCVVRSCRSLESLQSNTLSVAHAKLLFHKKAETISFRNPQHARSAVGCRPSPAAVGFQWIADSDSIEFICAIQKNSYVCMYVSCTWSKG